MPHAASTQRTGRRRGRGKNWFAWRRREASFRSLDSILPHTKAVPSSVRRSGWRESTARCPVGARHAPTTATLWLNPARARRTGPGSPPVPSASKATGRGSAERFSLCVHPSCPDCALPHDQSSPAAAAPRVRSEGRPGRVRRPRQTRTCPREHVLEPDSNVGDRLTVQPALDQRRVAAHGGPDARLHAQLAVLVVPQRGDAAGL